MIGGLGTSPGALTKLLGSRRCFLESGTANTGGRQSDRAPVESQPDLGLMAAAHRVGADDTTVSRTDEQPSDRQPSTVGGLGRYRSTFGSVPHPVGL